MPLPNTRVLPAGWQAHHQPTVVGGMTVRVRLRHPPSLGVRDPDTGRTPLTENPPYYDGPARVQARTQARDTTTPAGRDLTTAPYLLAVPPHVTQAQVGDIGDVYTPHTPSVVTMTLHVVDTPTSSISLQRDLGCELHQPTTNEEPPWP